MTSDIVKPDDFDPARGGVEDTTRRDEIDAGLDHVLRHDAELLRRLADA